VDVCGYGEFLATQIAAHPLLLDELIDERCASRCPDRAELETELQAIGSAEVGRRGRAPGRGAVPASSSAAVFRVAIADLSGVVAADAVSDRLTEIAELIVERALEFAWQPDDRAVRRTGCVEDEATGGRPTSRARGALGYGKLGGIELGYGSDLDLVFLHDSAGSAQETDRASGRSTTRCSSCASRSASCTF
jgi:glutamate-ammonia-ligase adenylyltransferase